MVDYYEEVRKEAVNFIDEIWDEYIKDLLEEKDGDMFRTIDDRFTESVTDRSYTVKDAAFVIDNSNNIEEDYGLWEGEHDPSQALEIQACYTYANDVRVDVEEIYEDLLAHYEDTYDEVYADLWKKHTEQESYNDEDDYDPFEVSHNYALGHTYGYFEDEYKDIPEPVTDLKRQISLIEKYFKMGENSNRSGYPVGGSYIDARCGVGFGMQEELDYVNYDHYIAKVIPDIRGMYREDVRKYLEEIKGKVKLNDA